MNNPEVASEMLVQSRMWLVSPAARVPYLLGHNLLSTSIPRSFSACSVAHLHGFMELFGSRCRTLPLSVLNFMSFLLVHSSVFSRLE